MAFSRGHSRVSVHHQFTRTIDCFNERVGVGNDQTPTRCPVQDSPYGQNLVNERTSLIRGQQVERIISVPVATPNTDHPQLTAAVGIPQTRYLARVAVVTVVWQHHVPTGQAAQKTVDVQPNHDLDRVADVPVVMERQGLTIQTVQRA